MGIVNIKKDKETGKAYIEDYRIGAAKIEYVAGKLSDLKEWYLKSDGIGDLLGGVCAIDGFEEMTMVTYSGGRKFAIGVLDKRNFEGETMKQNQILYCEKYGIMETKLDGQMMTYYASHRSDRKEDCVTYKVIVDLKEFREVERTQLKHYYKKGEINMYL